MEKVQLHRPATRVLHRAPNKAALLVEVRIVSCFAPTTQSSDTTSLNVHISEWRGGRFI